MANRNEFGILTLVKLIAGYVDMVVKLCLAQAICPYDDVVQSLNRLQK